MHFNLNFQCELLNSCSCNLVVRPGLGFLRVKVPRPYARSRCWLEFAFYLGEMVDDTKQDTDPLIPGAGGGSPHGEQSEMGAQLDSHTTSAQEKNSFIASMVICVLSLSITIPQTIVAVNVSSAALLADSLAMWSDAGAYVISSFVIYLIFKFTNTRQQHIYDILGAVLGLLLLLASAIYITITASQRLKGVSSESPDPEIALLFSCMGAVVNISSMAILYFYARLGKLTDFSTFVNDPGRITILSVSFHVVADFMRTLTVFASGLIGLTIPEDSMVITVDSICALVIGGFMYFLCVWLLYVIINTTLHLQRNNA